MTSKMMKTFSDLYDNNKDGTLDSGERAMLFTSMVVQPESLMLKASDQIRNRYYGVLKFFISEDYSIELVIFKQPLHKGTKSPRFW